MDKIFATHDLSDNGPPFNSHKLDNYFQEQGIKHKITLHWPQANGEPESSMKPLKKAIRTARIQGEDWKHALYTFLLNYRTRPHTTTKEIPAKLLYNHVIRNGISTFQQNPKTWSERWKQAEEKIDEWKGKNLFWQEAKSRTAKHYSWRYRARVTIQDK